MLLCYGALQAVGLCTITLHSFVASTTTSLRPEHRPRGATTAARTTRVLFLRSCLCAFLPIRSRSLASLLFPCRGFIALCLCACLALSLTVALVRSLVRSLSLSLSMSVCLSVSLRRTVSLLLQLSFRWRRLLLYACVCVCLCVCVCVCVG